MNGYLLLRTLEKKIKLFIIFWTRIVFVKSNFKVSLINKLKSNFFGGYLADQYALYGLNKKNKKYYLSEFDWYKSRYINEPYNFMLNNKIVCNKMLEEYIRVPKIYFFKKNKSIIDENGLVVKEEVILNKLKEEKELFIKPISAGKGSNVYCLGYSNNSFIIDNEKVTTEQIIKLLKNRDWFISEKINQAKCLSDIYDKTSNTIRLITLNNIKTNQFEVFFAVQRIGTKATIPVDTGSRGGLVSKIDIDTGTLTEARTLRSLNVYEYHPDSNFKIKGFKIPNWNELKKTILEVSNEFPFLNFIAWDILMTDDGPVIIEANTSSGVNIIQLWGGQRQDKLGAFYKQHDIIK